MDNSGNFIEHKYDYSIDLLETYLCLKIIICGIFKRDRPYLQRHKVFSQKKIKIEDDFFLMLKFVSLISDVFERTAWI